MFSDQREKTITSSKPGVGGIFFLLWLFSVTCYLPLPVKVSSVPCTLFRLGNSKAAAHVAVDLAFRSGHCTCKAVIE